MARRFRHKKGASSGYGPGHIFDSDRKGPGGHDEKVIIRMRVRFDARALRRERPVQPEDLYGFHGALRFRFGAVIIL